MEINKVDSFDLCANLENYCAKFGILIVLEKFTYLVAAYVAASMVMMTTMMMKRRLVVQYFAVLLDIYVERKTNK